MLCFSISAVVGVDTLFLFLLFTVATGAALVVIVEVAVMVDGILKQTDLSNKYGSPARYNEYFYYNGIECRKQIQENMLLIYNQEARMKMYMPQ
jgi:hypothetical protein